MKAVKIKLAWAYMSLFVGFCLMALVNLELLLRMAVTLAGKEAALKPIKNSDQRGVE
jgi:TRAP-type C4-dicarboxylate transport system permease small subunit